MFIKINQLTKKKYILYYIFLLLAYAFLVSFHFVIMEYFKIQLAPETSVLQRESIDREKTIKNYDGESLNKNYIYLEFYFKLEHEPVLGNLFQTAWGNTGIRVELSSNNASIIIPSPSEQEKSIDFKINKKIMLDEWHHIKLEALKNEFIIVYLDEIKVVNLRAIRPHFDISEIIFAKDLSGNQIFQCEIKNVNLMIKNVQEVIWLDSLLTIFAIFLILNCYIIIINSTEEGSKESSNPSENKAYLNILFIVYIVYLGSFFITNYMSRKEVPYWPIILIVLAPFSWSWLSLRGFFIPVPVGFSLFNVRRNIDCVKTPAMAALFVYITNKAVVSWLLPSDQLPLDYFITEYLFGLVLFFIGFMRLAVDFDNFLNLFFIWLSPLVAVNGLINIYKSPAEFMNLVEFSGDRLIPSYGPGVDVGAPTSAGLTYAVYFYGLMMALLKMSINQLRWKKCSLFFIPFLLMLTLSLYLTHTRGAALGLVVSCLWSCCLLLRHQRAVLWQNKIAPIAIVGSAFVLLFLSKKYFFQRDDSARFDVWRQSLGPMQEHFLFGSGDRGFGRYENGGKLLIKIILPNGSDVPHAHNIFFNAIIRGGLISFFSLVIFFYLSIMLALQITIKYGDFIPLGTLIIYLISGLFDFDLHIYPGAWMLTSNWVPLLIACASKYDDKIKVN